MRFEEHKLSFFNSFFSSCITEHTSTIRFWLTKASNDFSFIEPSDTLRYTRLVLAAPEDMVRIRPSLLVSSIYQFVFFKGRVQAVLDHLQGLL